MTATTVRKSRGESRAPQHPPHKGRNGGLLQTGGTNPGAGRPPNEYKEALRGLAEKGERSAYMRRCISGKLGWKAFAWALAYCSDRARGKPTQPVNGEDGGPIEGTITLKMVKAR